MTAARIHARLWAKLAAKDVPIDVYNLMLAAAALAHCLDVASHEKRSFPRYPELKILSW